MSSFDEISNLKVKKVDSEKKSSKSSDNFLNTLVSKDKSFEPTHTSDSVKDLHKQHFLQTIQQLKYIRQNIEVVDELLVNKYELPKSDK